MTRFATRDREESNMAVSNYGYENTVAGRDENGRASRVIDRADGSKHGHVWTDDGICVAFIIDTDRRAFVGASRVRREAWEQVLVKREAALGG